MGELSNILNAPAGIFFYQLTILLVIFGAIIVLLGRKTDQNQHKITRLLTGLYTLLLFRLMVAFTALLTAAGGFDAELLTWADRGLSAAAWIIFIWLWGFPEESNRSSDTGTALTAILAITLTFSSIGIAAQGQSDTRWMTIGWSIFSILTLLAGMFILFRKKSSLWGYGMSMLMTLLFAEAAALMMLGGSSPPMFIIRLASIAAYPILLTLPQQLEVETKTRSPVERLIRSTPERKRVNLPPLIYEKFLALAAETDLLKISRGVTETVSYAMVADICLIISRPTSQEEIIIYCGYDQVLEQEIIGAQIASRHLPMIASAMQKHAPLRLPASSASSDLKFLSGALHLPKSGHLLVAPINTAADLGVGALILLTPYSSRTWTLDDQTYLSLAAEKVGLLLEQSQANIGMKKEIDDLRKQLSEAEASALIAEVASKSSITEKFGTDNGLDTPLKNAELLNALQEAAYRQQELESEISTLRENHEHMLSEFSDESWEQTVQNLQAENIQLQLAIHDLENQRDELNIRNDTSNTAHQQSIILIDQLKEENDQLRNQIKVTPAELSKSSTNGQKLPMQMEAELNESLREIAHLKNLVGEAEIKILELENLSAAPSNTTRQWEMIITLAEEMRQPMSSILGYSDFLLAESVGLLGTLQRKFLERVKTSTNRMSAMVEDLIHIAVAESGKMQLNIGPVDLTAVIDSAISTCTVQMREKTITLLVNLPEELPTIQGDREAIRLTLIHLLQNAAAATPVQGKITIGIKLDIEEDRQYFVQMSVSDSGGGIPAEDIPRVFEKRFKSKNELIPGLGVSSSGLSIAKTLVEAHGGRIWVENSTEEGATFCILLPMKQEIPASIFESRSQ